MNARRQALAADIVVINHHLFFADLAVRESGMAELLPSVHTVIFDEAHQLNAIGVQFLGKQLSTGHFFEFSRDRIESNLKMGYFDALKAFRRVDGFFHYFTRTYFRKLMDIFDLETLRGIEKAAQLYKIDRYQLIRDDSFLKTVAERHKEAIARYQATKSTNWLTTLLQDPRRITEMIDDGIILGWAQEQRDSAARIQKNWRVF